MKVIHRSSVDHLEIQAMDYKSTVTLNLGDGRKIVVENSMSDTILTVVFGHTNRGIECFDEDGENIGTLRKA